MFAHMYTISNAFHSSCIDSSFHLNLKKDLTFSFHLKNFQYFLYESSEGDKLLQVSIYLKHYFIFIFKIQFCKYGILDWQFYFALFPMEGKLKGLRAIYKCHDYISVSGIFHG